MKKIITTAIIAAMLTATLAGCDNNSNSNSSDLSSGSDSSISDTQNSGSDSNSDVSSDNSTDSGDVPGVVIESKSAADRLNAVFNAFPQFFSATDGMAMVVCGSDMEKLNEVFPAGGETPTHCVFEMADIETGITMFGLEETLAAEDVADMVVAQPMMSAQLKQILIVKPAEGMRETVKFAVDEFTAAAKEGRRGDYPAWEAERAGTVSGETADGYFYVVVAAEGADMAAVIENG